MYVLMIKILPRSLDNLLWEKLTTWIWGEDCRRWWWASVIWLLEISSTTRDGSTKAPSATVCIWLWDKLRVCREGRPRKTAEWRTWRLFLLRSRIFRLSNGEKSSVCFSTYLTLLELKLRTCRLLHCEIVTRSRVVTELLARFRILIWDSEKKTLGFMF